MQLCGQAPGAPTRARRALGSPGVISKQRAGWAGPGHVHKTGARSALRARRRRPSREALGSGRRSWCETAIPRSASLIPAWADELGESAVQTDLASAPGDRGPRRARRGACGRRAARSSRGDHRGVDPPPQGTDRRAATSESGPAQAGRPRASDGPLPCVDPSLCTCRLEAQRPPPGWCCLPGAARGVSVLSHAGTQVPAAFRRGARRRRSRLRRPPGAGRRCARSAPSC
jgi:hypothetical protein